LPAIQQHPYALPEADKMCLVRVWPPSFALNRRHYHTLMHRIWNWYCVSLQGLSFRSSYNELCLRSAILRNVEFRFRENITVLCHIYFNQ